MTAANSVWTIHSLSTSGAVGLPVMGPRVRWIDDELPEIEQQREYAEEKAFLVVVDAVEQLMVASGTSRAQLADRLGVTKGRVSRMLNGGNITVSTLGRMLQALDAELTSLVLVPFGTTAALRPSAPEAAACSVGSAAASPASIAARAIEAA